MKQVTIFGYETGCVYCDMAKRLCTTRQLDYRFIPLSREDNEKYKENREKLDKIIREKSISQRTFPFVFVGDVFVGGFEEFRKTLI